MGKLFGGGVLSLCLASGLFAQLTSLNGTVTDPSGAVVPNATISIMNSETGRSCVTPSPLCRSAAAK
jgi:hypothetical protein